MQPGHPRAGLPAYVRSGAVRAQGPRHDLLRARRAAGASVPRAGDGGAHPLHRRPRPARHRRARDASGCLRGVGGADRAPRRRRRRPSRPSLAPGRGAAAALCWLLGTARCHPSRRSPISLRAPRYGASTVKSSGSRRRTRVSVCPARFPGGTIVSRSRRMARPRPVWSSQRRWRRGAVQGRGGAGASGLTWPRSARRGAVRWAISRICARYAAGCGGRVGTWSRSCHCFPPSTPSRPSPARTRP